MKPSLSAPRSPGHFRFLPSNFEERQTGQYPGPLVGGRWKRSEFCSVMVKEGHPKSHVQHPFCFEGYPIFQKPAYPFVSKAAAKALEVSWERLDDVPAGPKGRAGASRESGAPFEASPCQGRFSYGVPKFPEFVHAFSADLTIVVLAAEGFWAATCASL